MTINPDPRWNRRQNEGVTPSGPGLRPFGAEPQDASQAKPLVPNAGDLPEPTYDKELRLFAQAMRRLWVAVQEDEMCDLTECVFKFSGNCHCMATFLALGMDALSEAVSQPERTRA